MEKYDPIRVLGEGSFGKVYLMRDKVRRKFVCVKIIKIKNIPKKEREATKVEVELLKRLNHPNIVRYIDSFLSRNNESLCIAMEYCDGGDLASQIKAARRKLFSEDKILHWFVQIALGVHYMHTKNVLHRDLKTQNIFLLGNGRLVLGDLGISKVLEGTMDMAQTCIGTPYYMSPEIFKNKPYSYKSDVWALGCVLYEMTTLNHAFDANSLNGLAQKIIKGRYPAIHHKYSRYLRELIGHMLLPEPKQRPDLDQILRKPFIKKHILQFFQDIQSRPSEGIGEGTMIVRAAVGGPVGSVGNDANMLSFREQLESLGMTQAMDEAHAPVAQRAPPTSEVEAKKLAKDASNALKREKDHRKMVESALEKLRQEREARAKERLAMQQQGAARGRRVIPRADKYSPGLNKEAAPSKPAALRQPRQSGLRYDGRDANPHVAPSRNRSDNSVASNASAASNRSDRGKRQSEAREKHILEERERAQKREEKRVHDAQAEERRRAKEREDAAQQKRREEMAKAARDQARAQQDVAQKREAQRERERARQQQEIDQLKKDKLELDKRAREREALRDQRRRDERSRLEGARMEHMQDKLGEMNDQVSRLAIGQQPAEEKLSARERVQQRKQEKQAKDDAERLEALRRAEEDNRRVRERAAQQQQRQYRGHVESDQKASYPADEPQAKGSEGLGMDELTAKLHVARGAPRYDRGGNEGGDGDAVGDDDSDASGGDDEMWGDEDPDDAQEEEEIMHKREEELQAELNMATKRCQELKETLQVTKSFIDGRGTKLAAGAAGGGHNIEAINSDDELDEDDDEVVEYDEEDEAGNSWDEQSAKSVASVVPPAPVRKQESVTPRRNRPDPIAVVKQPSYKNLSDAPSPSGRLGDRIVRLKQRCILALGSRAFNEAYTYLKEHAGDDNDDDMYDDDDGDTPKQRRIREILGPDKAHYMPLIDQLVFMEESHGGG